MGRQGRRLTSLYSVSNAGGTSAQNWIKMILDYSVYNFLEDSVAPIFFLWSRGRKMILPFTYHYAVLMTHANEGNVCLCMYWEHENIKNMHAIRTSAHVRARSRAHGHWPTSWRRKCWCFRLFFCLFGCLGSKLFERRRVEGHKSWLCGPTRGVIYGFA